jgi:hypothetical protein
VQLKQDAQVVSCFVGKAELKMNVVAPIFISLFDLSKITLSLLYKTDISLFLVN